MRDLWDSFKIPGSLERIRKDHDGVKKIFWDFLTFLGDSETQFGLVGYFVGSLGFFKDAWESGENPEES